MRRQAKKYPSWVRELADERSRARLYRLLDEGRPSHRGQAVLAGVLDNRGFADGNDSDE